MVTEYKGFSFPMPRGTKVVWNGKEVSCPMTKDKVYVVGGRYYDDYMTEDGRYSNNDIPYICVEADDMGLPNGWVCTYFKEMDGPW